MGIADWFGRGKKAPPPSEPIIEVPPAPTSESLLAALDEVERMARDGVVPPMVMARLKRVTKIVRDTIPRLNNLGDSSYSAYNVMAVATDYLPGAIGGYLRLPRDWADSRPVDRGKTSLLILIDQLDLLGGTMDKILDAVNRADAQALVVHGRFLQEKFGSPAGGDLGIGENAVLPPMPTSTSSTTPGGQLAPPTATPDWAGPQMRTSSAAGNDWLAPDDPDTGDVPIVHRSTPPGSTPPADPGRLAPPIGRES
ncbi:MAG: hypothetical protein V9G19_14965 [Tetrasphaera sp.]